MIEEFIESLEEEFEPNTIIHEFDEVTMVVDKSELESTCLKLRDYFGFEMLIDLCGLDSNSSSRPSINSSIMF